ncbi:MAG: hypothetical protein HY870_14405 [Chloroflexi bacterium]|nr:hypothetical protein [Chloroflexota bacterium]
MRDILTNRKGVIGLLLIAAVTYTSFYAPIVYMDDWSQIVEPMTRQTLTWVDWADRRPLLDAPLQILHQVFGLNLDAFYLVAWFITTLAAVQLYLLIRQFRPAWQQRAWAVAALTLVYPADFSQMWLAHVLHARLGWLLALVAASCMLTYLKRRTIGWVLAATALSSSALLLYEAQLGIFIAFGLLAIVLKRAVAWRTRLMLLIPLGVNGVYTLWRSVGFRMVGIQDEYLSELTLGIADLLGRLLLGFQVLWWSWTEPVRRLLQVDSNWLALLIMLGVLGSLVLVAMGWARRKPTTVAEVPQTSAKPDWLTLLIGASLIAAGYFPTILLYEPNLDGVYSRVNFYALPGAALCLVIAASAITKRLARGDARRWRAGFMTAICVLIALGMAVQMWVRHNAAAAWQEQRGIWAQLIAVAPQFEPGTLVCFVLTSYLDQSGFANWGRTPLSTGWEASAALRLLYDDPSLQGAVIMPEGVGYGEAKLLPTGVQDRWLGTMVPYARTVFLTYDKSQQQLTVLTEVSGVLGLDWSLADYEPYRHIVQVAPRQIAARRLIVNP